MRLKYVPQEKIEIRRPVNRIAYIELLARKKRVLDIGCYDETALVKRGGGEWLHEELSKSAEYILGIDNSSKIPEEGIALNEKSRIVRGDALHFESIVKEYPPFDMVIGGELIEHLPDALEFFIRLKAAFAGREFICSTPNASSLTNILLGLFKRESTHEDHLHVFSFKTLYTLCRKAGFDEWEILPYHVYFTEMILRSRGTAKLLILLSQKTINVLETVFPLLSGGLILHVRKI